MNSNNLDDLAKAYYRKPTTKNLNKLLIQCEPQIHIIVSGMCKNTRWTHADRQDMFSNFLISVWKLLRKYPRMKQPDDDNFNFKGLINRHLSWRARGYIGSLTKKIRKSPQPLFDPDAIYRVEHPIDLRKLIEDKEFIEKIREKCAPRLNAVLDMLELGHELKETAKILNVAPGTIFYRLKTIKKIALDLLESPDIDKLHKLECSKCNQWLPKDKFTVKPDYARGYHYWCRPCCNTYAAVIRRTKYGCREWQLTYTQAGEIRKKYAKGGILQSELAVEYNVSKSTISKVICRSSYTCPRKYHERTE
ncbi:hypothetical protein LCGC14_1806270 [marine sediment metagenome]|uniref:Uncharacterized protein n=1 Tax=marine sediment metagenome TaxID=412755 RepID=A0A0F9GNA3_9ZZZZ